mmetsp:Transcript_22570/g.47956  ORF Transcript_22570/g.47956 Transcript_22570/m.47956 type:complete len:143 (-) Transcript_22570:4-432(-)
MWWPQHAANCKLKWGEEGWWGYGPRLNDRTPAPESRCRSATAATGRKARWKARGRVILSQDDDNDEEDDGNGWQAALDLILAGHRRDGGSETNKAHASRAGRGATQVEWAVSNLQVTVALALPSKCVGSPEQPGSAIEARLS